MCLSSATQGESNLMRDIKIVVERHPDTYIAYPIGLGGVVVGQGDTFEEALESAKSAIEFHIESFGDEVLQENDSVIEAFIAEARIAV
jgi:predicted RNase H-like HicB family nuclease